MQEAIPRSCCVVAEVGVKTHTSTCQTHILLLPDLCDTKLPQRRGKKKKSRQTHQDPYSMCFVRGGISGSFASLREEGLDFFPWPELGGSTEAHTDTPVLLYKILEKGGSSQLILLPVVKQLIVLKQLGQTIASLMAQLKHGRDRNHNIF